MKKFAAFVMCSLLLALTVVIPAAFAQTPEPVRGGKLVYAIPGTPDTLDPQMTTGTLTFQHVKSAYDTLVEPDEQGKIVPALAESWEFSPETLTLTFHLRKGVVFHNGDSLTAADVKATFDRMLAPDSASPYKPAFSAVKEIRVVDDATVEFALTEIFSPLIGTLASGWSAILPKRAIEEGHDFSTHPLGTGPFVFQEWVRDDHLSYLRFDSYWMEGKPYVDELELKVVIEPVTQLMGLETGEFDGILFVEPHTVPQIESNPDTKLFTHPTGLALVVTMNHARAPFDNLLVRQAISHAIDRQALLDIAYFGGEKIEAFLDAGNPYYLKQDEKYPYNPAKAKELLAEAGYPNGFEFTLTLPQNYTPHVNAGNMAQNMLKEVGIQANIKLVDWGTWISQVYRDKEYDMTIIGHTGQLDPHNRLASELDYTNYKNPQMTELIKKAATVYLPQERKALYDEVQRMLANDAVMVFIGTSRGLRGLRSNVHGFRMTYALETPDFRDTFKTK